MITIPDRCEVMSHRGLDLHSLMVTDVEHLCGTCRRLYVFFGKMFIQIPAHF